MSAACTPRFLPRFALSGERDATTMFRNVCSPGTARPRMPAERCAQVGGFSRLSHPPALVFAEPLWLHDRSLQAGRPSMTKAEIIDCVYEKVGGFSKKESAEVVEAVFETMKETLAARRKGKDFRLRQLRRARRRSSASAAIRRPASRSRSARDACSRSSRVRCSRTFSIRTSSRPSARTRARSDRSGESEAQSAEWNAAQRCFARARCAASASSRELT